MSSEVSSRIADIDAEESRALSAEASLEAYATEEVNYNFGLIVAEESRATSAEAVLTADLSSEVSNRIADVDAEASYRVSGDLSLQNQIDFITSNVAPEAIDSLTEIVSAFQSADGDINGAISALADAAGANLSTEVARAGSVEAVLTADLSSEISNRIADVDAEESRAMSAEASLTSLLSTEESKRIYYIDAEVSNRIADVDAEESRAMSAEAVLTSDLSSEVSNREDADASIAAELSSDIEALADVDGTTIVLNGDTNQIELKESIAAPSSGIRTLMGEIDIETILKVGGVDVMAAMASGDASLEVALSTEVSYLIANTDLGSIDSFAEVVADLSSEVSRAIEAENQLVYEIYVNRPRLFVFIQSPDGTNDTFTANVDQQSSIVFLNGLMLTKNEDYTISDISNGKGGGTIAEVVFTSAPAATDKINIYGVEANGQGGGL